MWRRHLRQRELRVQWGELESVPKGLERNVGLRSGGALYGRFRRTDFTPEVMWKQGRLLSLEGESGESMKGKLVWVARKESVAPAKDEGSGNGEGRADLSDLPFLREN